MIRTGQKAGLKAKELRGPEKIWARAQDKARAPAGMKILGPFLEGGAQRRESNGGTQTPRWGQRPGAQMTTRHFSIPGSQTPPWFLYYLLQEQSTLI